MSPFGPPLTKVTTPPTLGTGCSWRTTTTNWAGYFGSGKAVPGGSRATRVAGDPAETGGRQSQGSRKPQDPGPSHANLADVVRSLGRPTEAREVSLPSERSVPRRTVILKPRTFIGSTCSSPTTIPAYYHLNRAIKSLEDGLTAQPEKSGPRWILANLLARHGDPYVLGFLQIRELEEPRFRFARISISNYALLCNYTRSLKSSLAVWWGISFYLFQLWQSPPARFRSRCPRHRSFEQSQPTGLHRRRHDERSCLRAGRWDD